MNENMKNEIERAEDIAARCDALMEFPPNNLDGLMKARAGLKEAIAELEALQGTLPDNRYPCVGTNRKLPKRSLLRSKLEREFNRNDD